jgi:hypothetical protein
MRWPNYRMALLLSIDDWVLKNYDCLPGASLGRHTDGRSEPIQHFRSTFKIQRDVGRESTTDRVIPFPSCRARCVHNDGVRVERNE